MLSANLVEYALLHASIVPSIKAVVYFDLIARLELQETLGCEAAKTPDLRIRHIETH
jgi:hypothetical protein